MRILRVLKASFSMIVLRWDSLVMRAIMLPVFLLLIPVVFLGVFFFRKKGKLDDPAAEFIYPHF